MQDTAPHFDQKVLLYRIAQEVWPDLDTRFPELFKQFDAKGNPVPNWPYTNEPQWDTVTSGFSDGTWTIRPGIAFNFTNHLFVAIGKHRVSVDQWGDVYTYAPRKKNGRPKDRIEYYISKIVADVIRDILWEADGPHVGAFGYLSEADEDSHHEYL